jgi:hypothetical protein
MNDAPNVPFDPCCHFILVEFNPLIRTSIVPVVHLISNFVVTTLLEKLNISDIFCPSTSQRRENKNMGFFKNKINIFQGLIFIN